MDSRKRSLGNAKAWTAFLAVRLFMLAPLAAGALVWRVDVAVPDSVPGQPVAVTGLADYGVVDIYPDENGDIHLWLPDGDYKFAMGAAHWTATVDGADTAIVIVPRTSAAARFFREEDDSP